MFYMYNRITIKGDGDVATIYKEIQKERFVHMIHIYNTHIHIIVIVITILSSCFTNVLSILLLVVVITIIIIIIIRLTLQKGRTPSAS